MAVYTVHEPPPRKSESVAAPERFAFVRDGFYFWAFVFAPLWMLVHRLWLVFIGYLLLTTALSVGVTLAGLPGDARALVALLIHILVGIEAGSLRRWTLTRRRWKTLGVVVGDDLESAESRFFAVWADKRPEPVVSAATPPSASLAPRRHDSTPDVIGWIPDTGAPR